MKRHVAAIVAGLALALVPFVAIADGDAGGARDASVVPSASAAAPATPLAVDAQAPASVHGCVPTLAKGASRPVVSEDFPHRGTSGWIATLTLTVRHGKGEHVLPSGFHLQRGGEADKELRAAGFAFPEQDAGTGAAMITVLPDDAKHPEIVTTIVEVPFVLLPEKPGRNALTLPPLPVAVARANGDVSTECTRAHFITVEDPIADTPEPEPRGNPPPRVQREEWKEAKIATIILAIALVLGLVFGLLFRQWKNRPRPVPPPPPPRPAWEIALEKLHDVRHAGLLDTERAGEFCDRVSDALREYVGKTLGFDGLERTTDEIAQELARSAIPDVEKSKVLDVLRESDLVKFAKFVPDPAACVAMLDTAEAHVRRTMPRRGGPAPKRRGDRASDRDDALEHGASDDAPKSTTKSDISKPQAAADDEPREAPAPSSEATVPAATSDKTETETAASDAGSQASDATTSETEKPRDDEERER